MNCKSIVNKLWQKPYKIDVWLCKDPMYFTNKVYFVYFHQSNIPEIFHRAPADNDSAIEDLIEIEFDAATIDPNTYNELINNPDSYYLKTVYEL